jgi:transcriptional regulator with XRE-family HTH domain
VKKAPNHVDRHVGSRVRLQRMLLGLSQEKLGEALGLTFQQVQKYEKGTNRIGASRLQQIAQFLKVEIAYLTAYRRKSSRVASPKKVPPMSSIF